MSSMFLLPSAAVSTDRGCLWFLSVMSAIVRQQARHTCWRSAGSGSTGGSEERGSVDKSCIELKQLPRQSSTASSSDTYTSCQTHPHSSPSATAHLHSDKARHNLYVNPLGDPSGLGGEGLVLVTTGVGSGPDHMGSYEHLFSELTHGGGAGDGFGVPPEQPEIGFGVRCGRGSVECDSEQGQGQEQFSPASQIVQQLDAGLTTTWQRGSPQSPCTTSTSTITYSPTLDRQKLQQHLQHHQLQQYQPNFQPSSSSYMHHPHPQLSPQQHHQQLQRQANVATTSSSSSLQVLSSIEPRKSSFKRHKSLSVEKHPRFSEVKERTYSSTDNLTAQGFQRPKLKFRKAVSLASRLHSSPGTGRKLASYHLIASTKSGAH
ncbi:hypothetical protein C0Q70_16126 [Pomacea canaliculata]|uniref:Uncharacterized protein n=1 Tax=Pomacea canaliculata TaxID=400727 RepID=A0A2T7NNX0_POMCA|nr:hypothetical protein C0Q70_16126 [Pomacea canaliculata]